MWLPHDISEYGLPWIIVVGIRLGCNFWDRHDRLFPCGCLGMNTSLSFAVKFIPSLFLSEIDVPYCHPLTSLIVCLFLVSDN